MNKVRTTIQGMILTFSMLMLANSAQAQSYWGSGFSGGMQGCMADTKAYSKLGKKEKKVAESLGDAQTQLELIEDKADRAEDKRIDAKDDLKALFKGNSDTANMMMDIVSKRLEGLSLENKVEINDNGELKIPKNLKDSAVKSCKSYVDGKHVTALEDLETKLEGSSEGDQNGNIVYTLPKLVKSDLDNIGNILNSGHRDQILAASEKTISEADWNKISGWVSEARSGYTDLPEGYSKGRWKKSCTSDGLKFGQVCSYFKSKINKDNGDVSDCEGNLEKYYNAVLEEKAYKKLNEDLEKKYARAYDRFEDRIEDLEGDYCEDCAIEGYMRGEEGPSTGQVMIGALAGLAGQYLGLRAYRSAQRDAIDTAAQLGHTMRPIPSFNMYAGLGLSAVSAISGLASGAYRCAGSDMYGGVHGMNNPYAMQMAMMGRGGAFGYPFGMNMMNPMMGMYMPGNFGMMGPMGMHTPFHMMGQMNPALMMGMNPYASMMGPMAQFNPMAMLGPLGMMGMPGAQFGMQGAFNPYGMMSPYGMMNPFGGLSAMAGMGPFSMNPYQMMNPALMANMNPSMMMCIQAPCPGQLFNPMAMGMNTGLQFGPGMQNPMFMQQNQQAMQMQMQMLQQQQQQQMAYYQQLQAQQQRQMQATQQLTQLQQQIQQLNMQAAQISSQAGIGGGVYGGGLMGLPSLYGGGGISFGANFGGGFNWGGFPYGVGQFSPNAPVTGSSTVNSR